MRNAAARQDHNDRTARQNPIHNEKRNWTRRPDLRVERPRGRPGVRDVARFAQAELQCGDTKTHTEQTTRRDQSAREMVVGAAHTRRARSGAIAADVHKTVEGSDRRQSSNLGPKRGWVSETNLPAHDVRERLPGALFAVHRGRGGDRAVEAREIDLQICPKSNIRDFSHFLHISCSVLSKRTSKRPPSTMRTELSVHAHSTAISQLSARNSHRQGRGNAGTHAFQAKHNDQIV